MSLTEAAERFDWTTANRRLESLRHALQNDEHLTPEQSEQLLRDRAIQLARVPKATLATTEVLEVVQFRLGNELYAIATEFVLEITRPLLVTQIPETESHFVGLTNLRGEVTAIIDLGDFFGIQHDDAANPQVLVLGRDRPEFGITITELADVVFLQRDRLLDVSATVNRYGELLLGCTDDGMLVLDGNGLLHCESLYVDQMDG